MSLLRFPNPVSDIRKFWSSYKTLYQELNDVTDFGHDDITRVMIDNGLVTAKGSTGQDALQRSYREDRSRDSLYNQIKMYSELFRMLGWIHPGRDRTHFITTELGSYIATPSSWEVVDKLVKECVLSIVFPNPNVENRSGHIIRPFLLTIKLMKECNGIIFRDELINEILSLSNDRSANILQNLKDHLLSIRGNDQLLASELVAKANGNQVNTLYNYTRFPLGVLRSSKWSTQYRCDDIYENSSVCYKLNPQLTNEIDEIINRIDIRIDDLIPFTQDERANFLLLSHYTMLGRAGAGLNEVKDVMAIMEDRCQNILNTYNINRLESILFSPYQQASKEELSLMERYYRDNYSGD